MSILLMPSDSGPGSVTARWGIDAHKIIYLEKNTRNLISL